MDETNHSRCVNAWMERAANGLPPERMIPLFEQGFAALWGRAHQTLGDVTLSAIVERVIVTAAEQFPFLTPLKLKAAGLFCQELQEHAASLPQDQLAKGIRFVLVEFLTVLGNLTAEILTPALHAELSKVAPDEGGPDEKGSRGRPSDSQSKDGEGAK